MKIPNGLECNKLYIDGENIISKIPKGFKCNELYIHGRFWIRNGIYIKK